MCWFRCCTNPEVKLISEQHQGILEKLLLLEKQMVNFEDSINLCQERINIIEEQRIHENVPIIEDVIEGIGSTVV